MDDRMFGVSNVAVMFGLITVFIAVFTLFFIFDQIHQLANSCSNLYSLKPICQDFTGFSQNLLIIVLFIAGFVMVIVTTAYILISS